MDITDTIWVGNSQKLLEFMPDSSMDMCVTSPPYYGLRDYQVEGQIGQNQTKEEYVLALTEVFAQVKRVLKPQGTLWLNLGDTYCGTGNKKDYPDPIYKKGRIGQKIAINHKVNGLVSKNLMGIPWTVAFALQKQGWILRQDIIWHKPNAIPESVKDRCTRSHEYLFLFSKRRHYYYNAEAIQEFCVTDKTKKKNKRDVWIIPTKPYMGDHFAVYPLELVQTCIKAGCPKGGIVFDPFMGVGTTALAALHEECHFSGIELNATFVDMAYKRIQNEKINYNQLRFLDEHNELRYMKME